MAAIPDGGWAEVEWGVRWTSADGQRVDNLSNDQERARLVVRAIPKPGFTATLVAREVAYGPWLECKP